jgi:hypothetical protein
MAKLPKSKKVEDEPGAEERFLSGVRKALETPHKPHKAAKPVAKKAKNKK